MQLKTLPTKTLLCLEPTILDVIGSLWGKGSTELSHLYSLNTKEKTYYSTGNELPLDTEVRASSASRYSWIIPVKFCILVLQADLETSEDPNWKWFSGSADTLKGFLSELSYANNSRRFGVRSFDLEIESLQITSKTNFCFRTIQKWSLKETFRFI